MSRKNRPDKTGRSEHAGGKGQKIDTAGAKGVVVVPQAVITSPAFRSLSPLAAKLLLVIQSKWHGYNNGRIHLSTREMHDACGTVDNKSQARAVRELVELGFVQITSPSDFKRKRLAREFRLTYIGTGEPGRPVPASNDYLIWTPAPKRPRETAEIIEWETHAGKSPIGRETLAVSERTAGETHSMDVFSPRRPERSPARETHALIYNHHTRTGSVARHDADWLQSSTARMLDGAQRGAKVRLAEAIGATPVQLSRLLNHGKIPGDPAIIDRLAAILNNGGERRRYGSGQI